WILCWLGGWQLQMCRSECRCRCRSPRRCTSARTRLCKAGGHEQRLLLCNGWDVAGRVCQYLFLLASNKYPLPFLVVGAVFCRLGWKNLPQLTSSFLPLTGFQLQVHVHAA